MANVQNIARGVARAVPRSAEQDPELAELTEFYSRQADNEAPTDPEDQPQSDARDVSARVLPHDLDAEAAVISAVLSDQSALAPVLTVLRPEHFFSEPNRQIFEAVAHVHSSGQPVDAVTVGSRLSDTGRLTQIGGTAYLAQLVDAVPFVANVETYAKIVRDKWRVRQLISTCTRIAAQSYDVADVDGWIAQAQAEIIRVENATASRFEWVDTTQVFGPLPATRWIVPGLQLCPGRPAMLQAYGATGKTIIAQALALAVASDTRAFGEFLCGRGLIARHVDYEQGLHATFKRYQRLALGHGIDPAALNGRLLVSVFPSVYLNTAGAEDIWAREFDGVALGIVDAFRGAIPGDDENDSTVRAYIDSLSRVSAKTGTAFLLIHHSGKTKDGHSDARQRGRGSSAIFDACGCVLDVTAEKNEPKKVEQVKQPAEAEGGPMDDFYLRFDDVAEGPNPRAGLRVVFLNKEQVEGMPKTPAQAFESKVDTVLDCIRENPGTNTARLSEILSMRRATVTEAVNVLLERGAIQNLGSHPSHPQYHAT